ncbi:MAG: PrsW family intramembrane metalloprotease [Erysipelotrichia bacterium]|nr:PrsW family intramembrane metalloprotease [Erysipelotrichia bacterium]
MLQSESAVFSLILLLPPLFFYLLFKQNWVDRELRISFFTGLIWGTIAILFTRLLYVPVEMFLETDLRSFVAGPGPWWMTLLVSIGIIGFVEESMKAAGGLMASYQVSSSRRPAGLFMSFAGCALSFSLLENVQYYMMFGVSVIIPRIIISSTAHLFFACLCAAMTTVALSRNKSDSVVSVRILSGIFMATLAHGLFDFFVFHFDVQAVSGVIATFVALFLLGIYEAWIIVLKVDIPAETGLSACSGCGAFSIDRVRFCGFCGSRVIYTRTDLSCKISSEN